MRITIHHTVYVVTPRQAMLTCAIVLVMAWLYSRPWFHVDPYWLAFPE